MFRWTLNFWVPYFSGKIEWLFFRTSNWFQSGHKLQYCCVIEKISTKFHLNRFKNKQVFQKIRWTCNFRKCLGATLLILTLFSFGYAPVLWKPIWEVLLYYFYQSTTCMSKKTLSNCSKRTYAKKKIFTELVIKLWFLNSVIRFRHS